MEFPDWVKVKEKTLQTALKVCHEITLVIHTNMDKDSHITETIVYLYTYSSDLISLGSQR